jgi:hypothetical protein
MVKIENRFEIGQIVYLKTDPDQLARSDRPDLGLSELN